MSRLHRLPDEGGTAHRRHKNRNRRRATYRDRLDHLADAGGAYLVFPTGCSTKLSAEQQQQIVHIVEELARTNPRWASNTTYQVLHWVKVHPGRPEHRRTDLARHHHRHRPDHRDRRL